MTVPAQKIGVSIAFIAILLVTLLTLAPLIMMFVISFQTVGGFGKSADSLLVADFRTGDKNLLSAPIGVSSMDTATTRRQVVARFDQSGDSADLFAWTSVHDDRPSWWTEISQDILRFDRITFAVSGDRGALESLVFVLEDEGGRRSGLPLAGRLIPTAGSTWNHVDIPVSDFDMDMEGFDAEHVKIVRIQTPANSQGEILLDDLEIHFAKWTILNFKRVLLSGPFGRYAVNSVIVSVLITVGNLVLSSMVGFAFAWREFRGKTLMFGLILGSMMIPPEVLMVPTFLLFKNLGWLNTYIGLVIPNLVSPFNIFLMRQYIRGLPRSMEEAARMDGAGDMRVFFDVVLPLCKPALAVVGINTFLGSWNSFLYPFLLTTTQEMRTLPVGLALFNQAHAESWTESMAASSLTALPVILVFFLFQRQIISGITAGATKG